MVSRSKPIPDDLCIPVMLTVYQGHPTTSFNFRAFALEWVAGRRRLTGATMRRIDWAKWIYSSILLIREGAA